MNHLERKGPWPVTVIVADLNGLKVTNDNEGHAAGDALLRRAGEVLMKGADTPAHAARVGGDEFVSLLPGTDERGGTQLLERLQTLVDLSNQFYGGQPLNFAFGMASCATGDRLEATVNQADKAMYAAPSAYCSADGANRRRGA